MIYIFLELGIKGLVGFRVQIFDKLVKEANGEIVVNVVQFFLCEWLYIIGIEGSLFEVLVIDINWEGLVFKLREVSEKIDQ